MKAPVEIDVVDGDSSSGRQDIVTVLQFKSDIAVGMGAVVDEQADLAESRKQLCRSLKSLLLGYYDRAGKLVFVGRAGTEFSLKLGHKLVVRVKKIERPELLFAELPREYRRGSGRSANDPNGFAIGSFPAWD